MIKSRSGFWWTHDGSSKRVPGTLVRGDDHWRLNLIGALPVNRQRPELSLVPPVTIYGSCAGVRYTLRNSYLVESAEPLLHRLIPTDTSEEQCSQIWRGQTLLEGAALPDDTLFKSAVFELTGLSEWWPFTGLESQRPESSGINYQGPKPTVASCEGGLIITIRAGVRLTHVNRSRSISERIAIEVEQPRGFTFNTLIEEVVVPLRSLMAIALHRRTEYFNCRLQVHSDAQADHESGYPAYPILVDPEVIDPAIVPDPYGYGPTFTANDIDVSAWIPKWLPLAKGNPVALAVAEPRTESGSLQSQVVEAVNAAETLHRTLHDQPDAYPFADKVWEELRATNLNRRERTKVRSAVSFTELSLEKRLLELAQGLGEEFCGWFFQDQAANWAFVAATVRNALSHGLNKGHRVEHDLGALIGTLRFTHAVIRLRLLVAAGLPADEPLIITISKDHYYLALMKQTIANWSRLRTLIESS